MRPRSLAARAVLAGLVGMVAGPVLAAPGAALFCPPVSFANANNLAPNPSLETPGPFGPTSICPAPCTIYKPSAAAGWTMHTDNAGSVIVTTLVSPSTVPFGTDPGKGQRMLYVRAGGAEGGVFFLPARQRMPSKLMFQVWVFVEVGEVQIGVNGANTGPYSISAKLNQWEVLRVCTDGTVPTDVFYIYNQVATGGRFYIDRIEIRQIP